MPEGDAAVEQPAAPTSTKRALAFVYIGYAFRYLYLLVLIPFYGRVLGAAEYGHLVAAMSLYQVVWLLTEYGFYGIGARDVAIADRSTQAALYGRHLVGRVAMAGVGLTVGLAGTYLSPLLRVNPAYGILATFTGIVTGFNLGWFFQGTLRFRTSVMLEVFGFAMNLPLILFFVRGPRDGWFVMGALLTSSVICTSAAHGIALAGLDRSQIRFGGAIELVRVSTSLFIARSLDMFVASGSTYLISLFATATQLGWYGASERLVTAGLSLMLPANQVLVNTVSGQIGAKDGHDKAFSLIRKAALGMAVLGGGMMIGSEVIAGFIVPLIFGQSFLAVVPLLRIMAILFPFAAMNQVITNYVLIPFRFERFVPRASGITAVVTIALILALGRLFGVVGVAWARVLGEAVSFGLLLYALRKTGLSDRLLTVQ